VKISRTTVTQRHRMPVSMRRMAAPLTLPLLVRCTYYRDRDFRDPGLRDRPAQFAVRLDPAVSGPSPDHRARRRRAAAVPALAARLARVRFS
jgi:hypothetical protein